jgi:hypothetical protein
VYRVRGASIDRPNLHLVLDDGTIAFTEDICGRITGAYFEGDGEVLLRPPNKVERRSLALFTGMAILEEQFTSAYFRFNDDTASSWEAALSPLREGAEFAQRNTSISRILSEADALRSLLDFSHFLPTRKGLEAVQEFPRFLHSHLQGKTLGNFELFFDAGGAEPLWAGQVRLREGMAFWDVWTSFRPTALRKRPVQGGGARCQHRQIQIRVCAASHDIACFSGGECGGPRGPADPSVRTVALFENRCGAHGRAANGLHPERGHRGDPASAKGERSCRSGLPGTS